MPLKSFLFCLFCLAAQLHAFANAIDSIRTKEDVVRFISAHMEKGYLGLPDPFRPKQLETDSGSTAEERVVWRYDYNDYGTNSFYKMDIDGDGKTDLVLDGRGFFIVMDKGAGFEIYNIGYGDSFINTIQFPDSSKAIVYKRFIDAAYAGSIYSTDTLVYKFSNFIEYQRHPASLAIKRMHLYEGSACFGNCEDKYFEIGKNGFTTLTRKHVGMYDSTYVLYGYVDTGQANLLWNLMTYMNPAASLKENYSIGMTEARTAWLNIYFEDGSVKKVKDYGFSGTMALKALYTMVERWENAGFWQQWNASSAHNDSLLVESPATFLNYSYSGVDFHKEKTDMACTKYEVKQPDYRFSLSDNKYTIMLFPDHHFVYTYSLSPPPNNISGAGIPQSLLAIGNWVEKKDTVSLTWNGYKTLAVAKDKNEWQRYFEGETPPIPVRMENAQFSHQGDNVLHWIYKPEKYLFVDK